MSLNSGGGWAQLNRRSVCIAGCYENRNFGDLLMLDMLAEKVAGVQDARPVCGWTHRSQSASLRARSGHGYLTVLTAGLGVFGGGGYLHHTEGLPTWRLRRFMRIAQIWRARRTPYGVFGVGIGAKLSHFGERAVAEILDGAEIVCLRDPQSAETASALGVAASRLEVLPDMVLTLDRAQVPADALCHAAERLPEIGGGKLRVGLHLESLRGSEAALRAVVEEVVACQSRCRIEEVVALVDHDASFPDIVERVLVRSGVKRYVVLPKQRHWDLPAFLTRCDLVVSTKLHVCVAATALGVPVASLWTHEKSARFFAQIGRQQLAAPASLGPAPLRAWLEAFSSGDGAVFRSDEQRIKVLKLQATKLFDRLQAFVRRETF